MPYKSKQDMKKNWNLRFKRNIKFIKDYIKSIGKCESCGYDKNINILQFHHSNEKKFNITDPKTRSIEAIKEEIDNCLLLCPNCHMEEHWRLKNV